MKNIQNCCLYISAALLLLFSPSVSVSEEFVAVKMYPEHVGVFTTDGKQQFVAFGKLANGQYLNITTRVDWISSNPKLVTINENGLARIVSGVRSGQVKVTCRYPKTPIVTPITAAINLLLGKKYQPKSQSGAIYLLLLK